MTDPTTVTVTFTFKYKDQDYGGALTYPVNEDPTPILAAMVRAVEFTVEELTK